MAVFRRFRTNPRTVLPPAVISRPGTLFVLVISMSRRALSAVASVLERAPGCVYPSMTRALVIVGRLLVRKIVFTVPSLGGMSKAIVSNPALRLALVIAARKEPAPPSLVVVTVNVAARRPVLTDAKVRNAAHNCFQWVVFIEWPFCVASTNPRKIWRLERTGGRGCLRHPR